MAVMLCEIAILTTLFVTVAASDGHCTSFRRRSLHVGEGPTRPSCPGPRSIHTPSGNFNRNVTAPSAVMCGLICMRDGICESFRYCQDQNLCQLNISLPQETMKTMWSTGCVLFDKEIQKEHEEVADASSTSVAPPCEWNHTTARGELVQLPSALPAPLRLEFKAERSGKWAFLKFSANTSDNELYDVGIVHTGSTIKVMGSNAWALKATNWEGSFVGSVIVITIDSGLITVDGQESGFTYSYQDPSPPQVTSWYVAFGGYKSEIQWDFVDPCNPF